MLKADWEETLVNLLKKGRGERSQAWLANRAGISDKTVNQLENKAGKSVRCATIARLALALDQDPNTWLKAIGLAPLTPERIGKLQENLRLVKDDNTEVIQREIAALEKRLQVYIAGYLDARLNQIARRVRKLEGRHRKNT